MRCSVNAFAGREGQYRLTPSAGARKVLVVGGGPAGMEAARIAALRGDDVTLWEKEGALGGQLIQAAMSAHKHGIRRLVDYYIRQLTLRRVHVELRKEATPEKVIAAKANAVVVATGAFPAAVTIPGLSNSAITARQVLEGAKVGGARVVIIGGGMVGCETAEILLEMGKSVVIIEMLPELASTMRPTPRKMLLSRLAQKSVRICTSVECRKISDDGAVIWDRRGQYETIPFDTLVVAVGSRPDDRLFTALQEALPAVYRAGDCVRPRTIMEAVDEGMQAGLAVHASN